MAIFPDGTGIKPLVPHESGPIENVRRNEAEDGASQSRDLWGAWRFYAVPEFELPEAKSDTVWDFWLSNRATTFTYYDFAKCKFSNEVIGTGDGSNLTFTIPAKETSGAIDGSWSLTVEVADGVGGWTLKTAGTHYNITSGTGALGEDRVVFTGGNAPANGRQVRITYRGRHRYTCEWDGTPQKITITTNNRVRISMRVRQAF